MKIIISVILLTIAFCSEVPAAESFYSERSGLKEHFPDNNVYTMFKDSKGLVWYGTMFGLIMSDGSNYFRFSYDPNDSSSISNDDIVSIFEDSKGRMWFGSFLGGLNVYERSTGKFSRFLAERKQLTDNTVWCITEDRKGIIWAGTDNGLNKLENDTWSRFDYSNSDTLSQKVISLAADEFDNLYIGTFGSGLVVADKSRSVIKSFNLKNSASHYLDANFIRSILSIPGDGTYIGTIRRDAFFLPRENVINNDFGFTNIMSHDSSRSSDKRLTVFDFAISGQNELLIGTSHDLFKYNTAGKNSLPLSIMNALPQGQGFMSVLSPSANTVFASAYDAGLFTVDLRGGQLLKEYRKDSGNDYMGSVRKFAKHKGRLYSAGRKGIYELSDSAWRLSEINILLPGKDVSAILSSGNRLWAGVAGGLYSVDIMPNNKRVEKIAEGFLVNDLIEGINGEIIAGTSSGIKIFESGTGMLIREYKKDSSNGSGSLPDDFIISIYADTRGNLWAGTYSGLSLLEAGSNEFRHFRKIINDENSLLNNYVYSILEYEGKMYFGTAGGMSIFDGKTFRNFTQEDGLPDQVVNTLTDFNGRIITGSNFNINLFDPSTETFALISKTDDILNPSSVYVDDKNVIYFGGKNGIVSINTDAVMEESDGNGFVFSRMTYEIEGKTVSKDLAVSGLVQIPYEALNIRIFYSDENYGNHGRPTYYYKISGVDDNWTYNEQNTSMNIKKLEPGEHDILFKVVRANGSQYFSKRTLSLYVVPPFYRTPIFYFLTALAFLISSYMLFRFLAGRKIRRTIEIERARSEERDKIRYEASRDYHDELGHKLTRISIYSRNLLREIEEQKDNISKELLKIMETSSSLRESARDLIWSMDPGEDTLYDLVIRIKDFSESLLQETEMSLSVTGITENMKSIPLDMDKKRNLLLIAKEAVNNSVKYSEADKLKIEFNFDGRSFTMRIYDNGKGFLPDTNKEGFGFRSMRSRAEKIGASVSIVGEQGSGVKVDVMLKLKLPLKQYSLN